MTNLSNQKHYNYEKPLLHNSPDNDSCMVNRIYRIWDRRFISHPAGFCTFISSDEGNSGEKISTLKFYLIK